jgi:hypothetical protein
LRAATDFPGGDGPTITLDNGNLYLKDPHAPARWRMYFTSDTEFFMLEAKWANQQVYFDDKGKIAGIYILGNNYKEAMTRVSP